MNVNRDVNRIFEKRKLSAEMYDVPNSRDITSDGALSIVESVLDAPSTKNQKTAYAPKYAGKMVATVNRYFNSGKITESGLAYVINKKGMNYGGMDMFELCYAIIDKIAQKVGVGLADTQHKSMSMWLARAPEGKYRIELNAENNTIIPHVSN